MRGEERSRRMIQTDGHVFFRRDCFVLVYMILWYSPVRRKGAHLWTIKRIAYVVSEAIRTQEYLPSDIYMIAWNIGRELSTEASAALMETSSDFNRRNKQINRPGVPVHIVDMTYMLFEYRTHSTHGRYSPLVHTYGVATFLLLSKLFGIYGPARWSRDTVLLFQ